MSWSVGVEMLNLPKIKKQPDKEPMIDFAVCQHFGCNPEQTMWLLNIDPPTFMALSEIYRRRYAKVEQKVVKYFSSVSE